MCGTCALYVLPRLDEVTAGYGGGLWHHESRTVYVKYLVGGYALYTISLFSSVLLFFSLNPGVQPKVKAKAKAKRRIQQPSTQPDGDEHKTEEPDDKKDGNANPKRADDQPSEPEPKRKRTKPDPLVAKRLEKLENEKELLLTTQKWADRMKAMNIEVSESVAAAEVFDQTKGYLASKQYSYIWYSSLGDAETA